MENKFCSNCGKELESNINFCPNCGNGKNKTNNEVKRYSLLSVGGCICSLIGFFGFVPLVLGILAIVLGVCGFADEKNKRINHFISIPAIILGIFVICGGVFIEH